MSAYSQRDYMIQVKATCFQFDECAIRNPINCNRCLGAKKLNKTMLGDLLSGLGMSEKTQDSFLDVAKGLSQTLMPHVNRSNYWCFDCNRCHKLTSKIGIKHAVEKKES